MINALPYRHAVRQAPWRVQRQWAGLFLLGLLVFAMISALYLDVTANAAIAGREIQRLRIEIATTQRLNADLETQLAVLLSNNSMAQRAVALGFRPAAAGEIHYLVVPGYARPSGVSLALAQQPAEEHKAIPPEYTQSLLDWFEAWLRDPSFGFAGRVDP
ncbi:MAG: hypothetical protein AB1750_10855 [Chloroflexota bacterium]